MPQPEQSITTAEAARILRIDRSVLLKRVLAGRVPVAQKLPGATGAYLFNRSEIEALAAESASSKVAS